MYVQLFLVVFDEKKKRHLVEDKCLELIKTDGFITTVKNDQGVVEHLYSNKTHLSYKVAVEAAKRENSLMAVNILKGQEEGINVISLEELGS